MGVRRQEPQDTEVIGARFFRSPALHFLVIGALLFAGRAANGTPAGLARVQADRSPIVIARVDLEDLRLRHVETTGREPDAAAFRYMIDRLVEDEILYREALAMGLDRGDQTVRWRLVEKMEYLSESRAGQSEDEIVDRAIVIGLVREDPIIRGVLIRKYGMLVRFAAQYQRPTAEQLRDYYVRNRGLYENPLRVSFTHVFFSKQQRGVENVRADAEAGLASLVASAAEPGEAIQSGDVFHMGHEFHNQSAQELQRLFGPRFAEEIGKHATAGWTGPIRSSFGYHVVLISGRVGGGALPLDAAKSRIAEGVKNELRARALREKIEELKKAYKVEIQWGDLAAGRDA